MPGMNRQNQRMTLVAAVLGSSIVFLDYVDARDLEGLYASAACFAFASINEGFGIPLLEAMRSRSS